MMSIGSQNVAFARQSFFDQQSKLRHMIEYNDFLAEEKEIENLPSDMEMDSQNEE